MDFFDLPARTKIEQFISKSKFDSYMNTKQKKLFTDYIQRISWANKLSVDTINLEAKDIQEIHVFKIELKQKSDILKILEIINRSIPYHIIFWIEFNQEAYISTAAKHPHPINADNAVIDWTFTSKWFKIENNTYSLKLKGTLDAVFKDLCVQLVGKQSLGKKSMDFIVKNQQEIDRLEREITQLKSAISKSKQFNKKVDLNLKLKVVEKELKGLD